MAVKSPAELAVMRRAMRLSELGMDAFRRALDGDPDEAEAARAVAAALPADAGPTERIRNGPSFGVHASLGHAPVASRRLGAGEAGHNEVAGFSQGYGAHLFRSAVRGANPAAEAYHTGWTPRCGATRASRRGATTCWRPA
jgi:Xaa-Pro aminopeptidase